MGPCTANDRRPTVDSRCRGTAISCCVADLRRCLPTTSVTCAWWHRVCPRSYVTRSATSSRCKSACKIWVRPRSNFLVSLYTNDSDDCDQHDVGCVSAAACRRQRRRPKTRTSSEATGRARWTSCCQRSASPSVSATSGDFPSALTRTAAVSTVAPVSVPIRTFNDEKVVGQLTLVISSDGQ